MMNRKASGMVRFRAIVLLFLLCYLCSGCVPEEWIEINSHEETFGDLWVGENGEIFAVGNNGIVGHFNGYDWQNYYTESENALRGLWGYTEEDVFACGENIILHYDGTKWEEAFSCYQCQFCDVYGFGRDDVYAVGYKESEITSLPRLVHYDGTSWTEIATEDSVYFTSIWGLSRDEILITAGESSHFPGEHSGIYRLRNNALERLPEAAHVSHLYSISGNEQGKVFAAGDGDLFELTDNNMQEIDIEAYDDFREVIVEEDGIVRTVGYSGYYIEYDSNMGSVLKREQSRKYNLGALKMSTSGELFAVGMKTIRGKTRGVILKRKHP